eukprot:3719527-Amphidinium_carterae.1
MSTVEQQYKVLECWTRARQLKVGRSMSGTCGELRKLPLVAFQNLIHLLKAVESSDKCHP